MTSPNFPWDQIGLSRGRVYTILAAFAVVFVVVSVSVYLGVRALVGPLEPTAYRLTVLLDDGMTRIPVVRIATFDWDIVCVVGDGVSSAPAAPDADLPAWTREPDRFGLAYVRHGVLEDARELPARLSGGCLGRNAILALQHRDAGNQEGPPILRLLEGGS